MADSIERKLEVPVVALASMGRFAGLLGEIGTLGRILGREERAAELVAFFRRAAARPGPGRLTGSAGDTALRLSRVLELARQDAGLLRTGRRRRRAERRVGCPARIPRRGRGDDLHRNAHRLGPGGHPRPGQLPSDGETRVGPDGPPGPAAGLAAGGPIGPRPLHLRVLVLVGPGPRPGRRRFICRALLQPGAPAGPDLVATGDAIFKEFYGVEGAFSALCRILDCHEWTAEIKGRRSSPSLAVVLPLVLSLVALNVGTYRIPAAGRLHDRRRGRHPGRGRVRPLAVRRHPLPGPAAAAPPGPLRGRGAGRVGRFAPGAVQESSRLRVQPGHLQRRGLRRRPFASSSSAAASRPSRPPSSSPCSPSFWSWRSRAGRPRRW